MPRQPRAFHVAPGLPHHVVLRGNNRRRLFSYPRDHQLFLELVAQASDDCGVPLHALTLMPNHTHLVATPAEVTALSAFVKSFAQRFAWRRNRTLERSGKLFEERFYCKPITTETQLARTMAYVELNPVRAGLVTDPAAYRWTTYRLHAWGSDSEVGDGLWTPHAWYTALGPTPQLRCARYRDIVDAVRAASRHGVGADDDDAAIDRRVAEIELAAERPMEDRRYDGSRVAEPTVPYVAGKTAARTE